MKTYSNSLNRIFKSPLLKTVFIVMAFFAFLFVGTQEVDAAGCGSKGTTYSTSSGGSWSSNTFTITNEGYAYIRFKNIASEGLFGTSFELWYAQIKIDGTEIAKVALNNDYCNGTTTLYFDDSYTSVTSSSTVASVGKGGGSSSAWINIPYSKISSGSSIYVATADNWAEITSSITFTIKDGDAPSAPTWVSNSSGGSWTNQNVEVSVGGSEDYFSGIGKYQYSYNQSTWYNDWDSGWLNKGTWSAERNNTVYFRACDNAGNCSGVSSKTTTIRIDKTAPSLSTYGIYGAASFANLWTNSQTILATILGQDDASGIGYIEFYEGSTYLGWAYGSVVEGVLTLASDTEGEHTITVYLYDVAGNYIICQFTLYYDKTAPEVDFSTSAGTIGTNSGRYIVDNSISVTTTYSDDMKGIPALVLSSFCTFSSGSVITGTAESFSPTTTCDLSSFAIDFETEHTATIVVYDIAGNATAASFTFYKIDESRKIKITSFNILSYAATDYNWIGPRSLTSGYLAPIYTLSNAGYINNNSMALRDASVTSFGGILFIKIPYFIDGAKVSSGTYVKLPDDSSVFSLNMTIDEWYEKVSHGATHTFTITFKNIYGQSTSKSVSVTFDFTTPTTPSVANTSGGNWTNQNVTLTPSGSTDTGSGVNLYRYGSGTSTTSSNVNGSLTLSAEQDQYYYFRAYDKAGNYSSYASTRVRIDKTNPTMSSVSNTSSGNWTNQNVTLTPGGGADTGTYQSGFSHYQYSSNNSSWSSTLTTAFSAEQNSTYYYRPCDVAGNCGSSMSSNVKIDKTKPSGTISVSSTSGGNWTNQNVTVTVKGATDPLSNGVSSGLKQYDWTSGSGWNKFYTQSNITDQTNGYAAAMWSGETDFTLTPRVCDNAGNCLTGTATTKVRIDKTNPNGSLTIENTSSSNWTNQDVTLTISGATDTAHASVNSGISYYQFSYDGTNWAAKSELGDGTGHYNTSTGAKDTWSAERDNTVYFRACDLAGNCTKYSQTTKVRIDKTNPTFTLSNTSGGSWTNQNVTLTPSNGADTGTYQSGFSIYQYSTNNSSWSTVTAGKSYSAEQNSTYYFRACDVAGNCISKSSAVKIDKTNPSQPGITNSSNGNWTNKDVTLTATGGADTGTYKSGFSHYQYSTNNSSWSTLSTTTYTAEQNKTYYYRACDNAGNCGSSKSSNVKIDKSEPVGTITVDKNAKTATIEITDAWSIADSQSKVGSNYKYFLSKELNLTKAQVQAIPDDAWLSPETTGENGTTIPMNVSSGKYYLYVKVSNAIKDSATNTVAIKGLDDQYSYYTTKGNYVIYRQLVDINSTNYGDDSSSFDEDDMNKEMNGSIASLGAQVIIMDRIVMVTFANEATLPDGFTMVTINNVLSTVGYKLVTVDRSKTYDFEGSHPFEDVLIAKLDENNKTSEVEVMDLIVIITAPQVGNSGASTNVIEQGEEIGNVAVSFISDVEFNVEKEIIHNGVKVNKIDTNNPGVYEVRYTAIDVMGRVNKVKRTLVVKEGIKEEVEVKVEEIKETPEIITPVVVNNAPVEVQPEANANRKVVENVQVEMRIENKDEVKGYKKRKEVKEEKKSDLTFKLFSKWFFKVYDG